MAKRKRYKEIETLLTRALIADVAIFALYLLFAGLGITALKALTAIIAIIGSGLCLAFLYMCGEIQKRRSRWLVLGYACIVVCLLVSLVLKYPSPAPASVANPSNSVSQTDDSTTRTDDVAENSNPTDEPIATGTTASE